MLETRDENKRPILVIKSENLQIDSPCMFQDIMTVFALVIEYMNEIEEFQARGVVYIIDCQFFSPSHLKLFPFDNIVKLVKNSEAIAAGRHKGFHFVNMHPLISYPLKLAFECAKPKWKERLSIYKTLDEFSAIERKFLPAEYGGEKSFKELSENFVAKIFERNSLATRYNEMGVNVASYPKAAISGEVDMLKIPFNSPEFDKISKSESFGTYGSFRKLEFD